MSKSRTWLFVWGVGGKTVILEMFNIVSLESPWLDGSIRRTLLTARIIKKVLWSLSHSLSLFISVYLLSLSVTAYIYTYIYIIYIIIVNNTITPAAVFRAQAYTNAVNVCFYIIIKFVKSWDESIISLRNAWAACYTYNSN